MKVIYANIIWYSAIIIGLVSAAVIRHTNNDWENMPNVRGNYDVLYGILGMYLVACIVGLLSRKAWGYSIAISENAMFTILPLSIFITTIFMLMPDITFIEILRVNLSNLVVGLVSLIF